MGYSLSSSKVSVVIARRLNLPLLLFFPAWVVGWTTVVLKGLRSGQPPLIFGIILFGLVTGLHAYAWLWNLCGKEELEFTACILTWKRTLLGVSRNRNFRMNRIDNPHFENSRSRGKSRIPSGIGFSYEGKQLRIGDHLTQRDAKEIVAAVIGQRAWSMLGQLHRRFA
jgi:xanthosine utilization system XapX-like protein